MRGGDVSETHTCVAEKADEGSRQNAAKIDGK